MKKIILAAFVLGCVAGVHAEGEDTSAEETTRKIQEAPEPTRTPEEVTRTVTHAPADVAEATEEGANEA